jgi:hypothetical protein
MIPKKIIDTIKMGNAGRRDLTALLIYVREHLPNDMIKDLAHCVAHSDRDRGYAYSHIDSFISNLITVAQHGGTLRVEPIFPRDQLISELAQDLIDLGFNVTRDDIGQNIELIKSCLIDILADAVILLRNQNVTSCQIKKNDVGGKPMLVFVTHFRGLQPGPLTIASGNAFASPVFWE